TYTHDPRGNRTQARGPAGTTNYGYDLANRLTSVDPTTHARAISGGWYHSAAVDSDGNVWTWGHNGYGQLGSGNTTDRLVPAKLANLGGVVAVAASAYNTVALKADGTVWAWGANYAGQVGDGTTTQRSAPVQVVGPPGTGPLTGIVAIASGASHSVALRNDGTVWTWGYNSNGQLGDGSTTDRPYADKVAGLSGVAAVAGAYTSSYALKSAGTVSAWGYNGLGNLGDGTTSERRTPVHVSGVSGVTSLSSGYFHVLAAKGDGSVVGWGYNGYGQIGDGTTTQRNTAVAVPALSAVSSLSANSYFSLAARSDGTVATWGWNAYGQLASGNTTDAWSPQTRPSLANTKGLAAGANHALSLRPDASASGWGWNGPGTLGDGTTTQRNTPVPVSTYTQGTKPLASYSYSADGLRATKKVAGTTSTFTWDVSSAIPMLVDDGTNFYIYGPDGTPLEQIDRNNVVTWYHHDQLGSTVALSDDSSGATVATAAYDPYGRLIASTGKLSPLGFAGEHTDAETGFVYLRARYYDPGTGQFISRDPLTAMTGAPYSYVDGNPLNGTDPLGLFTIPGTNICIDIRDPSCRSIKEQHQAGAQQVANFAGGVLSTLTFGNERRISSSLGQSDKLDPCSGHYRGGEYAGYAVDAVNFAAAGKHLFSKQGLRIFGSRFTRAHIDKDVHAFQILGRERLLPHLQIDTWVKGVKGSGRSVRIPLLRWLF
ncbi:MAG TPA: RHS repeat-associated core domain-containing protein, partial [Egibacteraceae bacterium]|nr:RHS repeat-associated core domain-containing protein [Egibacteraceae bacterium]